MSTSITTDAENRLKDHDLLGFRVNPGTIGDFVGFIENAIRAGTRETVFYHNLHSLYTYFTSAKLRECYDRENITILADGMPIIWLLKLAGFDADREQRVTYVDFIWPMLEAARDNDRQVFHLGQEKAVQEKALEIIRERVPGIKIAGHDGYFDQSAGCDESKAVIDEINQHNTDLLLVGFGAPRQEYWLDAHRDQIDAAAVFTCGACMEYVAGAVKTPPRWMGKMGLEWFYRLAENPRRFAFRYLVEPVLLGLILGRNMLFKKSKAQASREAGSHADNQANG